MARVEAELAVLLSRTFGLKIRPSSSARRKIFSAFKKPLAMGTNRTTTVLAAIAAKWAA